MDLHEHPLPGSSFVGRQCHDLRPAGAAYPLQRVIVLLLCDSVEVIGRFLHRAFERRADIRRQAVPEFLVGDDRVAVIAVIGHRQIFLHLVELRLEHIRRRILLTVDNPCLQRLVHLAEAHHLRDCAKRAHLCVDHF